MYLSLHVNQFYQLSTTEFQQQLYLALPAHCFALLRCLSLCYPSKSSSDSLLTFSLYHHYSEPSCSLPFVLAMGWSVSEPSYPRSVLYSPHQILVQGLSPIHLKSLNPFVFLSRLSSLYLCLLRLLIFYILLQSAPGVLFLHVFLDIPPVSLHNSQTSLLFAQFTTCCLKIGILYVQTCRGWLQVVFAMALSLTLNR